MPENVKRSIRSNISSEFQYSFQMNVKVEKRKDDRCRFLKKNKSHERPLAMELRNVPFTDYESFGSFVHASKKLIH
jgi:hypothetical protein